MNIETARKDELLSAIIMEDGCDLDFAALCDQSEEEVRVAVRNWIFQAPDV